MKAISAKASNINTALIPEKTTKTMQKNFYLSVLSLMCLLPGFVQAQSLASRAKNSVRITVPRVEVQQPDLLHAGNSQSVFQYTDGLGMPVMTVAEGVTPLGNNLVRLTARNFDGRPVEEWMPAPIAGTGAPEPDVLKQAVRDFYDDDNPYTHYLYGGFTEITPPGQDWHNNNRKSIAGYDIANIDTSYPLDRINKYVMASETSVQKTGLWVEYTLDSYLTEDEEGRKTYSYYDQTDRLVLRRTMEGEITESGGSALLNGNFYDTYYIYNDKGQLCCVLPPKASNQMTINKTYTHSSNNSAGNPIDMYVYLYRYNNDGQCIAKKMPGAGWIYYVYDQSHRLILAQTALQRATNEWSFCKYDRFGRTVQTGTVQNTASHAALQNTYANVSVTESWQTGTGYTNNYPVGNNTSILTQNYYDSYDFLNRPAYASIQTDLVYAPVAGFDSIYTRMIENVDISLRGVMTGTSVSLTGGMTGEQLTAMYYDRDGRVMQLRSNNHLDGYDKYFFKYNFSGNLLKYRHLHKIAGKTEIVENYEYTYDDAGRLKETWHAVDNLTPLKISELEYDEACRLKKKTFHGGMYAMDYAYNVQNQLNSIVSQRFSQTLFRQNGNTCAYYDGNIAEIQETKSGSTITTAYHYDALKRLTSATSSDNSHALDMSFRYDANGNITHLNRNAWIYDYNRMDQDGYPEERVDIVDSLSFIYTGNWLYYVSGHTKDVIPYFSNTDFWMNSMQSDYPYPTSYRFFYDANGNRQVDENRQIAWIKYNSLNLPWKVQSINGFKTEYAYAATGEKRRTIETTPMNPMQIPLGATGTESTNIKRTNTTDDCGNFRYYNGDLKYIFTPDGYIDASNASSSNWRHVYIVKDYQGNGRFELIGQTLANPTATTYTTRGNYTYYPFGSIESGYSSALFQYNGNEGSKDRDHSLDFHFRRLDPLLGRFTTMDPLAELDYSTSPYAYCGNDPINYTDPWGLRKGDKDDPYELPEVVITPKPKPDPWLLYMLLGFEPYSSRDADHTHGLDRERERAAREYYEKMDAYARRNRELAKEFERNTVKGNKLGRELALLTLGETVGSASNGMAAVLKNRLAYVNSTSVMKPQAITIKTPMVNVDMSIKAANNLSGALKWGGRALGGIGMGFTISEMLNDKIGYIEGSLDLVMGAVGFIGPIGAAVSFTYFGTKWVLEATDNDFWNQ
jgi:RHS repeat-associated protein